MNNPQPAMKEAEAAPAPPPTKIQYPPGYRFMPTDAELIVEYLLKKINNEPIPIAEIHETYLRLVSPKELTEKCPKLGDNELYFFTPRDRKYPNGDRPNRGSQSGYWKATGADKKVMYKDKVVGVRKALVFYEGEPQKGRKTNWIMHEYRVKERERPVSKKTTPKDTKVKGRKRVNRCEPPKKTTTNDMRLDDWVLCKLYEKSSRVTNKQSPKAKADADAVEDEDENECSKEVSVAASSAVDNLVVSNYDNVQVPENYQYSSYDYHNDNFGDCSINPLLFEEELPVLMNGPFQSYNNNDYWMINPNPNPVEQANTAFGNTYPCVNEEAFRLYQQQADPIVWNEAFVSANTNITNNYYDPIYRHIHVEGGNKRVRYNF